MNDKMYQEKLLRPEEASKLLNITQQSLINWTNQGKLVKCLYLIGGLKFIVEYQGVQ